MGLSGAWLEPGAHRLVASAAPKGDAAIDSFD
jgi:hypothetical protein